MRALIKLRWIFLIIWVALTVGLLAFSPNMEQLVRDKGNITIPDNYSSQVAKSILDRHKSADSKSISATLVFHDKQGITASDESEINHVLDALQNNKDKLGITTLTTYRDSEDIRKQLTSKDNKTILAAIEIDPKNRKAGEIRDELEKVVGNPKIEHYFTGDSFIGEDVVVSSQNGLHKTELITVVFILVVLILVFRSIVAPFIPLITVGISYVVSSTIVAYLVDWFSFPLSNFTQIFMVAVLFGIGTDYCILLLSRFKEELPKHDSVGDAIVKTYQTAGKTVFFSALAVLIGFSSIALSKFSLYKSATGVAVGIVVLLLAFLTLVPLFMYLLGPRLFWPAKSMEGHGESKFMAALGQFSLNKPFRALLVVAVIIVPLLFTYNGKLSFNSIDEIGENYESVKGFNTIADSFGPGEVMPVQVVVEGKEKLDTEKAMAAIEKVNREITKLPSVEKVRSATRPLGDPVKEFNVTDQAKSLQEGVGKSTDGIDQIKGGLNDAKNQLAGSGPQISSAVTGIDQLINGTKQTQGAVTDVQKALTQIEQGIRAGQMGAGQVQTQLNNIAQQIEDSKVKSNQMLAGYDQLAGGLQQLHDNYAGIQTNLQGMSSGLDKTNTVLGMLGPQYKNNNNQLLADDLTYQDVQKGLAKTSQGLQSLSQGLAILNENLNSVKEQVTSGKDQASKSINQQDQLVSGLRQLAAAAGVLQNGNAKLADGQNQVISNLPKMSDGLGKIVDGQTQLKQGFAPLTDQLGLLQNGLGQSVDGLGQISNGLHDAQDYLGNLTNSPDKEMAGFYVPSSALESADFQQVFDKYLSKDKQVAKFDVVLKYNPYSNEALQSTKDIQDAVKRGLAGTDLQDANIGISGVSAMSSDMLAASNSDYTHTVIYMLIGIAIILILLLRSLVMPLYLIVSLLLCFFSSLAINQVIFVNILGYDGISWTMPFFGFVLLMALGVDYSIFLMDRFNEYKGMPVKDAMLLAMRNMGPVIFSAVIILGGTFAAMVPSGVLSLMQIATIVLSGLLLYAFVFLPFFIPVMVKLFGRANWFPFDRNLPTEKQNDIGK
ncbi:MMPL family transporter [Ectobacillus polymachus]|uniref:MMPL family transporter n=1 Tax=Ectobacillus polymachus TaxID=1508806 RepID=UPI003A8A7656